MSPEEQLPFLWQHARQLGLVDEQAQSSSWPGCGRPADAVRPSRGPVREAPLRADSRRRRPLPSAGGAVRSGRSRGPRLEPLPPVGRRPQGRGPSPQHGVDAARGRTRRGDHGVAGRSGRGGRRSSMIRPSSMQIVRSARAATVDRASPPRAWCRGRRAASPGGPSPRRRCGCRGFRWARRPARAPGRWPGPGRSPPAAAVRWRAGWEDGPPGRRVRRARGAGPPPPRGRRPTGRRRTSAPARSRER